MIDFTNLPTRKKSYGGANGNKLCVIINDQLYMLKLPSHAPKNINLSYANSCVSEYLGCHIFNMLGMKAQETILENYVYSGVNRISVACKDFEIRLPQSHWLQTVVVITHEIKSSSKKSG